MEEIRGVFIAENELPKAVWERFIKIAAASDITPQLFLKLLIIREIRSFNQRNTPLIDRILHAGVREATKLIKSGKM